jgi:hypothetical protein
VLQAALILASVGPATLELSGLPPVLPSPVPAPPPMPRALRGGGLGPAGRDSAIDGCMNPLLVGLLTCMVSPRMMWRAEKHVPYLPGDHGDVLWGTEDMDAHDSFDSLTAGLNQRIGSLPTPTIEHGSIKRRRQLGVGGFAVVFEADIPGRSGTGGGWSRTCACKVFSFIAGMGERQTNFFKNWLHELKVLDYLSTRPECGVVDFYGFSLRHEEAEAKIVVQICMELMRGGSLRDNLLVLKRKGDKVPLAVAFRSANRASRTEPCIKVKEAYPLFAAPPPAPERPDSTQKRPDYPPKRPVRTQKSPNHNQKRHISTQKRLDHTERDVLTHLRCSASCARSRAHSAGFTNRCTTCSSPKRRSRECKLS